MKIIYILLFLSVYLFSMSNEDAKHLLNRTSFGYTKSDLELFKKLSRNEAIDLLIETALSKNTLAKPKNIKEVSLIKKKMKEIPRSERKKLRMAKNKKIQELKAWWYKMMLESKYSFREKMTLFWHNHFVSEYKVVKSPYMMYMQNKLYRDNALGDFSELLHKSSQDLAMLIYLDSNSNKKSHANENYARELLELFTLGEGNYTEDDIREAARAFTGYRVNKKKHVFKKVKKHHDSGMKVFMGKRGNFDGTNIIDVILSKEETSRFITRKLYKEFISENINIDEVNNLSKIFRSSNYNISILMRNLLKSEEFWKNKSNMIKSPVEMIVSLNKNLSINPKDKEYRFIIKYGKILGQDLFNPPNVKGWIGGKTWVDTSSLVSRKDYISTVIKRKLKKRKIKSLDINTSSEFKDFFLPIKIEDRLDYRDNKEFYISVLTKPIYQIK